jgi:thymidylate kinase
MRSKASGPVVNPHGKPSRGFWASLGKLGLLIADWTIGYWFELVHARAKGALLLFDRYFLDLLVDPKRYRYGGPMWLARLVARFIPKPDIFVFLDLPAEVAHARKPEVPLEEARKLRERYLALARSLSNAYVVDASRSLEEVVAEVEEILLAEMHERTKKRLERLGLV